MDDSILSELHQKFGLNTRRDDQLDAVWKTANEDQVVDADISTTQMENKSKKKMDATDNSNLSMTQH